MNHDGRPVASASDTVTQPSTQIANLKAEIAAQEDEVRRLHALKQERDALLTTIRKLKVIAQCDENDARIDNGSLGADVQELLAAISQRAEVLVEGQQGSLTRVNDAATSGFGSGAARTTMVEAHQTIEANIQQLLEEEEAERREKMKSIREAKAKKKRQRNAKKSLSLDTNSTGDKATNASSRPRKQKQGEQQHGRNPASMMAARSKASADGVDATRNCAPSPRKEGKQREPIPTDTSTTRCAIDTATFAALEIFAASLAPTSERCGSNASVPPQPPWLNDDASAHPSNDIEDVDERYEEDFEIDSDHDA